MAPSNRPAFMLEYIDKTIRRRFPELTPAERNALMSRVYEDARGRIGLAVGNVMADYRSFGVQLELIEEQTPNTEPKNNEHKN